LNLNDVALDGVVARFRDLYDNDSMPHTIPYDGVRDLLCEIQARGVGVFVATNKPKKPTSRLIEKFFPGLVADHVCVDSIEGKRLSKTEMVAEILGRHRLSSGVTCVIGDGVSDMNAAVNLSCLPVAALYGYGTRDELAAAGARIFVGGPGDVLSIPGLTRPANPM
jgi:phosphoglycolate phosphatase